MCLKRLPNRLKTIGFRVAAWYSGLFILSSLALFLIAYFFLSATLKQHDHEEILLELREITSLYEMGGTKALEIFLAENNGTRRTKPLFIRVADSANQTHHIFSLEQWQDFDLAKLETIAPVSGNTAWIQLSALEDDYVLEISSARLPESHWVQVGMSSEGREDVLAEFRKIFLMVTIPLFAFGLTSGIFLSQRTLQPIRDIIKTVQSIEVGTITAKVPRSMTGDELDELARLFNEMLDNIHRLIKGMKNSLDNVAHDLRTPMTRLRNIADVALQSDTNTALLREALTKGIEESDHILKMLDTLMDISEAETGVMNLDRQLVDVSLLVEKIADMYQFVAEEKGLSLRVNAAKNLLITIDANRISQALSNIIDNAIKFTPPGGEIKLEARQVNNEIVIQIHDTGIGISPEELSNIWDRLYRGDQCRAQKGLGLGLSLVRGIVKAHQSRVEVVSEPGQGATFIISLPLIKST